MVSQGIKQQARMRHMQFKHVLGLECEFALRAKREQACCSLAERARCCALARQCARSSTGQPQAGLESAGHRTTNTARCSLMSLFFPLRWPTSHLLRGTPAHVQTITVGMLTDIPLQASAWLPTG